MTSWWATGRVAQGVGYLWETAQTYLTQAREQGYNVPVLPGPPTGLTEYIETIDVLDETRNGRLLEDDSERVCVRNLVRVISGESPLTVAIQAHDQASIGRIVGVLTQDEAQTQDTRREIQGALRGGLEFVLGLTDISEDERHSEMVSFAAALLSTGLLKNEAGLEEFDAQLREKLRESKGDEWARRHIVSLICGTSPILHRCAALQDLCMQYATDILNIYRLPRISEWPALRRTFSADEAQHLEHKMIVKTCVTRDAPHVTVLYPRLITIFDKLRSAYANNSAIIDRLDFICATARRLHDYAAALKLDSNTKWRAEGGDIGMTYNAVLAMINEDTAATLEVLEVLLADLKKVCDAEERTE